MTEKNKQRALFATKLGVIATTVGSSVGLGNIWRFPYEAGTHGGGAFLLCYIGFILLLGIPVICAEFIMGRSSRSNIFGAFKKYSPRGKWHIIGYVGIIASMMILSFYSVIAGWTMEYCYGSITGALSSADGNYQATFEAFRDSNWRPVLWTVVFLGINFMVLVGGVTKGIERVSNILMPLLFVILMAFCINSLLLPGASEGLDFFFNPDFSEITPSVLIGAMGQAFFSLSIGLGTMMTYASYFKRDTRLLRTSGIIAGLDTFVAVISALIIFPAVFTFGMKPDAGPALVFQVLPSIFHQMSGGAVWSTLFFFLLFMASLTSTISMSEISIAFFIEEKKMSRLKATLLNTGIVMVFAVLCTLSFGSLSGFHIFGMTIFDLFDYVASNILLPLGGLFSSLFVGWKLDRRIINSEMLPEKNPGFFDRITLQAIIFLLKWVAPTGILIVFLNKIGLF